MNVKLDNMTVMSITLTVQTHREVMIVTARKASLEMEKYALVSYSTVIKFIESYYPAWYADTTQKVSESCNQDNPNCTCFTSINGSTECGCSPGYMLDDKNDTCQGDSIYYKIIKCET